MIIFILSHIVVVPYRRPRLVVFNKLSMDNRKYIFISRSIQKIRILFPIVLTFVRVVRITLGILGYAA